MVNPDAFSALKSIFKSSKASEDPSPYSKHGVKDKHKPGTTSSPPHSHSHPTHPQPLTTRDQRRASRRYSGRPAVNDGSATLVGLEDKVLAITKRHADTNVGKAGQEDERVGRNKSKSREKSVRFNEEVQIENLDALRWADDVGPEGKTFVLKPNALGAGKVFGGSMDANLDHLPREDLAQVDGTAAPVPHDQQRRQSMDKKTIWKYVSFA